MQSVSSPWLHVRNHVLKCVTQEEISRGIPMLPERSWRCRESLESVKKGKAVLCFSSLLAPSVSSTAKTGVWKQVYQDDKIACCWIIEVEGPTELNEILSLWHTWFVLNQSCSTWIISYTFLLLFSCLQSSSGQRHWPKCYWSLLLWVVNYNYFIVVQDRTEQIVARDRRVKISEQTFRHSSETTKPCSGKTKKYCQEE